MPITTNTRAMQKSRTTRTYLEKGNTKSSASTGRTTRTCSQKQREGQGSRCHRHCIIIDIYDFYARDAEDQMGSRPKVATQEPTKGKTDYHNEKPQHTEAKTKPQEPILPQGDAKNEEADMLQDTKSMLKDFAQSVFATTSQVHIPQAVTMSAKRYATWVFNALP